jgi:hypothetical protein
LSSICTANKRDGSPCTLPSYGSSSLCWAHSPETAERRRRGQSRGGRNKPSRELSDIKGCIRGLIDAVCNGEMSKADAAVCGQLYNSLLRAVSIELQVREQEELERRLEELETILEQSQQNRYRREQTW